MPGHYPFYRYCNINRRARGAVRHRNFGKVTLTRWRPAKAGGRTSTCFTGGSALALMAVSHNPLLCRCCFPKHTHALPSCVCHPTAATDTVLFCHTPQGEHSLLSHSPTNYLGIKRKNTNRRCCTYFKQILRPCILDDRHSRGHGRSGYCSNFKVGVSNYSTGQIRIIKPQHV